MWNCMGLVQTCILIWLYLQLLWILFVNVIYFTVPWLVWGTLVIFLLIRFGVRIPPPKAYQVKKVLGLDPLSFVKKDDENEDEEESENDDEYCMRIIAHRGAGFDYPENSMTALRNSREKGCDAVEFDLALTKDNIPILFHDVTIDRLTGLNGTIKDMTWNQLKDYDISVNHPLKSKFDPKGEKIALFEDVLIECLQHEQHMFIDIKASGSQVIKVILDAYKRYPELYEKAVISSFNPITIYTIRRKNPRIVAGIAWRPRFFSTINYDGIRGPNNIRFESVLKQILASLIDLIHDWSVNHVTYYILGLSFILLHKDVINPEVVRQWNKRGIRVFAWTVNLPTEKRHFTRNLKVSILTDTLLS